jgi:protein-L-isoaspartate O-methyltransferase
VDHIQEINDFARKNIMSICPHLFKKKKIQLITQDGRKGLKNYGQKMNLEYDVIHVGG